MVVNGKSFETQSGTLLDLLNRLDIKPETVAIEIDGQIPERITWSEIRLTGAEKIEIIKFVGGG